MNPRAAINDLHPFQGCPFDHLGTSPSKLNQRNLNMSEESSYLSPSGESGIRTHAPFRTNGFQDRLVMTTSISLQASRRLERQKLLYQKEDFVSTTFLNFLSFFNNPLKMLLQP